MFDKTKATYALLAGGVLLCSGCATITSGTTQNIRVDTGEVAGANCEGVDKKGHKFHWLNTPSSTVVQKGDGPMFITCEKEGYQKATVSTDEKVVGATFGNIIVGGGVGFLVDAMSGAAQEYPDEVKIPMRRLGEVDSAESNEAKDTSPQEVEKSKEEKLADLKEMREKKLISSSEYFMEKKKILRMN